MVNTTKFIYVMLTLVVMFWGLNVVMVKYLAEMVPPFLLSAIRIPLAGIFFLPFVWRKYGLYRPNRKQWLLLAIIGTTSIFFHQIFLTYGLVTTTATNASLILGLNPLTTALLAALFAGEKMNLRLFFGILAGFSGVLIVLLSNSPGASIAVSGHGDLIMFLSMLTYVIGGLFIKKLAGTMPILIITTYSTLIGGVMLNLGAFIQYGTTAHEYVHFTAMGWFVLLLSSWVATSLGSLGWNHAIKLIGANKTAMFINGMPFASMIGAVLFLSEQIQWIHALAFILTTVGIVIGTYQRKALSGPQPSTAITSTGSKRLGH